MTTDHYYSGKEIKDLEARARELSAVFPNFDQAVDDWDDSKEKGGWGAYTRNKYYDGLETVIRCYENKLKNKPCHFFIQGKCKFGDNCKYPHMEEIKQPCSFFAKGTCKFGDNCKYQHNNLFLQN